MEARILATLRQERRGGTVVVVAYRKATIALADEVVHLEGAGSPTAAPTPSCSAAARRTPGWSTPTSRPPPTHAQQAEAAAAGRDGEAVERR